MRKLTLLCALLLPLLSGCIAYNVGTTARPIPKGEFHPNMSVYFVPDGIEDVDDDGSGLTYGSADFEARWGLSDRSDIALRVPAGSGAIVTFKQLLSKVNDPDKAAFSVLGGAGVVNWGNHAYVEAGLIGSGREDGVVPFGGVRAMHVIPISGAAVTDDPTAGVFGGLRIRVGANFSLSPELGIYYDPSALHLRKRDVIFVPSIALHWD